MKKNTILSAITLLQLALLFCICLFRFSTFLLGFCVGLSACLSITLLCFCRSKRIPLPAEERAMQPRPDIADSNHPEESPPEQHLPDSPVVTALEQVATVAQDTGASAVTESNIQESVHHAKKHTSTILVADDSEINRAILSEILGQFGLLTIEAVNGQEAVDIIREWDISLVLMDLEMPVMDGKEAAAKIRGMGKLPQDVPILAMTAHTDDSLRMDCLALGMNGYLTKPVDLQELSTALQKWLPGGLPAMMEKFGQDIKVEEEKSDSAVPINIDAGLAATGGNKKLYYKLLNRFVERYGHGTSLLRELLEKEAYAEASRLVHTIKGVAANLGMKHIVDITKNIENHLSELPPNDSLIVQFENSMYEVIVYIKSIGGDTKTVLVGDKTISTEDVAALLQFLENLPHKVERDWGGIVSALEKYTATIVQTPVAGEFTALFTAVDDFDLKEIERGTVKLQQRLAAL